MTRRHMLLTDDTPHPRICSVPIWHRLFRPVEFPTKVPLVKNSSEQICFLFPSVSPGPFPRLSSPFLLQRDSVLNTERRDRATVSDPDSSNQLSKLHRKESTFVCMQANS